MITLQICHQPDSPKNAPSFEVVRVSDGKHCPAVLLKPPDGKMVGASGMTLLQGLQWYLENFFNMPIEEFQYRADKIQTALKEWGRECFNVLFKGNARDWYHDARQGGLENLTIKIAGDDPAVLTWPWEALYSDDDGFIAWQCRIERQLFKAPDLRPFTAALPMDQLNILYVIARPDADHDIALRFFQETGDEQSASMIYHQLGMIALERPDFESAEQWYRQSLDIALKLGNNRSEAMSYHQLGRVAQERSDFAAAEQWYKQALAIWLKLGEEYTAAVTSHQLGVIAQELPDLDIAEEFHRQSLAIMLKLGNEHGEAMSYHQLGIVAAKRGDFKTAESLVQKSRNLFQKHDDSVNAEIAMETLHQIQIAKRGT